MSRRAWSARPVLLVLAIVQCLAAHAAAAQAVPPPAADTGTAVRVVFVLSDERTGGGPLPLTGVLLLFAGADGQRYSATTDSAGSAAVALPVGPYRVWNPRPVIVDGLEHRWNRRLTVVPGLPPQELTTAEARRALPAEAPLPDTAYAYAVPFPTDEKSWFVNQFARGPFSVRLANVRSPADCARRVVKFSFHTAGTAASPGPTDKLVQAQWAEREQLCWALVYWRLGDVPGEQILEARIVGDTAAGKVFVPDSVARQYTAEFHAIAHALPAPILGLAWTDGPRRGSDTETRRIQPIVGVDFPFVTRFFSTRRMPLLDRIRITVATRFGTSLEDVYAGVQLASIAGGPRAAGSPFQFVAGRVFATQSDGDDDWFVGGHVNAAGVLGSVLAGLGIAK